MANFVTFGATLALTSALIAAPLAAQEAATTAEATPEATQTPPTVPEGGASAVVATVNGTPITLGHMIVLRSKLPAQYQSLPDDMLFKGLLDQLVQQAALADTVKDKISDADRLALENDRRGYLSGVALQNVVAGAVTDESLQAAYDEQFISAEAKKQYNAAHILVKTEEEAADLKKQIDDGADFATLAREHSSDGAAANGGDLGWFSEGMMVKPFQDAVFAMEVGTVAGPVETQFGWHLIQLKETRIAEAPSLDEVRDELAGEIEQAAVEAHIKSVTDSAKIERPGEGFDPALLRDQSLLEN